MVMAIANEPLSKLQVLKLIQAVHEKNQEQISKLIKKGIPGLVNYSGVFMYVLLILIFSVCGASSEIASLDIWIPVLCYLIEHF